MNVGVIGCGYVFDHYMTTWKWHPELVLAGVYDQDTSRMDAVVRAYGLRGYASLEAMLGDAEIDLIVNLTSVGSHYDVTLASLSAGKHVYSEKPLTTDLQAARHLFDAADRNGVRLSVAPSNALGATAQSLWKAVIDGAVGKVRLVYAEFDDNPIHLMHPETWRSRTGAPWPYLDEYEQGCTHEHAGYHLTWLCSIFGPVESLTAFSKIVNPDKAGMPLPRQAPDFSVACLNFSSGVVARLTCSIGAPLDHRMRIFGDRGMIYADTYRNYWCPVYVEQYTALSLNARKALSVRNSTLLQRLLGVGGRRIALVDPWADGHGVSRKVPGFSRGFRESLLRRELGLQDKCLGIAELVDAVSTGRLQFPSPDFSLHLTELTLAIQAAGTRGSTYEPVTTFEPLAPPPQLLRQQRSYAPSWRVRTMNRVSRRVLTSMHAHGGRQ